MKDLLEALAMLAVMSGGFVVIMWLVQWVPQWGA